MLYQVFLHSEPYRENSRVHIGYENINEAFQKLDHRAEIVSRGWFMFRNIIADAVGSGAHSLQQETHHNQQPSNHPADQ